MTTTTTYEAPTASLLTALRQNLQVLGELALRYEVDTQPPGTPRRLCLPSPAPPTCSNWWDRRDWPPWCRSSCGCCCSTPSTASSASG